MVYIHNNSLQLPLSNYIDYMYGSMEFKNMK